MRARGLIPILLLNVIVSISVAFGVIAVFNRNAEDRVNERLVTFEVIITATPDPNVTPQVVVITTTPRPGDPDTVVIPGEALEGAGITPGTRTAPFSDSGSDSDSEEGGFNALIVGDNLPPGCIVHTLADGEFPSSVAASYGANFFELMAANNLTEDTARLLQIGAEIIVPLDGCPLELFVAPTAGPTDTPAPTLPPAEATAQADATSAGPPTTTPIPTVTLAATASNSRISIVEVVSAGDITRESITVRNDGMSTDIGGWRLTDLDNNTFTFPADIRLFGGAGITVSTRAGENTPFQFYWGLDQAIFEPGDVLTLLDRNGVVQATFRVP